MGNGCDHHQQINLKGTFLPLLCSKPSIKDVILPKWQLHSPASNLSQDPLSPKISCMGQVKRNNNNKINYVGFPVPYKLGNVSSKNSVKYFKLKKLFSGNNLTGSPVTAAATMKTSTGCRRKQVVVLNSRMSKLKSSGGGDGKENPAASNSINIETMDPPLPVISKGPIKQGDDHNTLWNRRSRGVALEGLQLQQIQLNRHQEPTTV